MTTPQEHRRLRELLGSYALGAPPPESVAALRAHLDGCAACRAELAEIAPLAEALRGVDADALSSTPVPPPELGERIRAGVASERRLVEARARAAARPRVRPRLVAAAAVLLVGAAGLGVVAGRSTAPGPPPAVAAERVPLLAGEGVRAETAALVAHTWGVEARFEGSGFAAGQVYRASFRAADGRVVPAGEFLGTGTGRLSCNLQSAVLRADVTGFEVVDAAGHVVLSADLPA